MTVERGDNCVDCRAKADEIAGWIGKAISLLPTIQADMQKSDHVSVDLVVVSFAFTNPNAQGIGTVLQKLQTLYGNQAVPIIVSWENPDGSVGFTCIGTGCANLSPDEQEKIACNLLGAPAGCTKWPPGGGPGQSLPDPGFPTGIGSPPPPPAPDSHCIEKICIQELQVHP